MDDGRQHAIVPLFEAVGAAVGDRDAIVWRDLHLTWSQYLDRVHRFANRLLAVGLGGKVDHRGLAGWESPHDHVALYLTNGNEYLEAMIGAFAARTAPVNINYRYVADELAYVLRDCNARAVVFHSRYAPTLRAVLPQLDAVDILLQVADESDEELLPGAVWYEDALAGASAEQPDTEPSPDDHYVLYTGGTTGYPKGTLWRQADFLHTALSIREPTDELIARAQRRDLRVLATPPFMHGAAHWNALSGMIGGGTIVIQDDPSRLDAADVLACIGRHRVASLLLVGDAFARPLIDELAAREYDLSSLRFVLTGGAPLSAPLKQRFLELVPGLRIVDLLGSSETGNQGTHETSDPAAASTGTFERAPTAVVLSDDRTRILEAGDPEIGWLAQSGRVPRGYLGDQTKSEATFPTIGGVRYSIAGDRCRLLADGSLELHGRDSVTINTGGEKVFAEEVELALKHHPAVYDVLVVGRPSERWGSEVVAVVQLTDEAVTDDELRTAAAKHIAAYKLPKVILRSDHIERSPSGKPDYGWARAMVSA